MQLQLTLSNSNAAAQTNALLNSLALFILTGYSSDKFLSSLVQYLAVLGINTQTNCLRTAKNFLYMLASVVYCVRVLAAEKILLVAKREDQTEADCKQFLAMRRQYLADSLYSLISIMLSLLTYSKYAALNEGNASNVYQLLNKKIFYLSSQLIAIKRFCAIAQSIEAKVEDKFQQICQVNCIANCFTVDLAQI